VTRERHSHVAQKQRDMGRPQSSDFITLARVVKTQGRHGEVAAEIHTDVPDRFCEGMKLFALPSSGDTRREVEIESFWPHKGWVVLKFRGIDSISAAEALIGSELQVPRAERAKLEEGWNYISDLVGCAVFDNGAEIGRIEDVQSGAGEAPLLIVASSDGRKFDVPFAQAYVDGVDIGGREVRLKLPEGMLEINAPMTAEEKLEQKGSDQRSRD
jgi:16S rRNA processing protein RimM